MKLFEINGFYGSGHNSTTVFVAQNRNGSYWYVAEGGLTVNKTFDTITEGTDIEELSDVDCFTMPNPIRTIEQFEAAIEA